MLETINMNNDRLKALLTKYLDGTATEEEVREVDEWYRSFEGHAGLTERLSEGERNALEQLLFLRISHGIVAGSPAARVVKGSFRRYRWAAASVLVLVLAGGIYLARNPGKGPATTGLTVTEQADRSAVKKIALPDGTLIWLNFDSKLRYTQASSRELWLEGEAYFEVAPQQGNAFLVHAGKLDVEVLGTSFNIDAYTPEAAITVTVSGGKVAVGNEQGRLIALSENQQAVYYSEKNTIDTARINAADYNAWREGQLVFRNLTFARIAQRLERAYNVRIRFATAPVANAMLTARFDRNTALKDILKMLCDIYGFSYREAPGGNEYLVYDDQPKH
ncbi:FecR domain-containing protein [uncultured Chitinophaga sp.]|jgi:Fe2+-dicitrate sensor, membrane component|uniref:FecR family protein n=1 Tax=uncultured Chitinophaga sp. TaxID=339340 RepID=UPI0026387A34|nr:FecR domain-containing protein [uncultured Chitinophaga sp.]